MKELVYIYKIMMRHYGYLLVGLFFMLGFAIFSGASITIAVPFFDYVFPKVEVESLYHTWPEFYDAIKQVTASFSETASITSFINIDNLRPLLSEYREIMEHTDSMLLLKLIAVSIFILIFIKNIFYYMNRLMFANLNGKTIQDIRDIIFQKYMTQSLSFFSERRLGDSLVRMVNDVEVVSRLFIKSMFNALRNLILILVYIRIAMFLNFRLFMISLIILPLTTYIITAIGKKIKKYSQRIQGKFSDIYSRVEEVLTNIKIVKAFGREEEQINTVKILNRKFFLFWRKSEIYHSFGVPISEMNGTLMGVIILLVGGREVISSASGFSFGQFGAFLLAVFSMLHPIKEITKTYNEFKKAKVSLNRISEVIDHKPDLTEADDAVTKNSFDDKIVYDDVYFSYKPPQNVLSSINVTINKGEKVALVGSSGSGKTTMSNLLLRLYDTTKGDITIDNISIRKIKIRDLRSLFGVVTQESLLFSDTIAANIRFGSSERMCDENIVRACKIAYADEFIERLPSQYDYYLHSKGATLSGGQKQRLCIARAIVADPPILILDEATSSLDSEAEKKVQKAIEQATKKRTVMIIAHRISTVLSADKIIVLDEGKIVGMGNHQELLMSCPKYKVLYDLQFNV